ncbi:MAG: DNA translocase FtsK, partial [Candidatus Paceibacteria bacterium]
FKQSNLNKDKTLENFDLEVDMGEVKVGPTVTQYTLKPPKGVKLGRITSLSNNLSLALAAHPIRIEAPIPGKSLVGVEVPNETKAQVTLKELLKSKEFNDREHDMMMALGKDVAGKVWFADLPDMPHLLIAGATGSGKTVCLNTIIMSLLYQNTPETLRFIMVDPKRVELKDYDGLPHLLTPVITKAKEAVNALEWTIKEMERRFDVLSESGSRNIDSYNKKHPDNKMPHLVFIIDELADLMQAASNEIESATIRLAQMARAVGIHLILATQRPSVDVITGLMKANIPARISFSVASATDSRVILDEPGAEKLVGQGDMLLSTSDLSQPARIQGAYISEQEVKRVVDYLSEDGETNYDESIVESQSKTSQMFEDEEQEKDELFDEAKKTVLKAEKGSASLLQRKLRIGYARAARILDQLHEEGIVGEARGSKAREITLSEQEIVEELDKDGAQNVYKNDEDNDNIKDEDQQEQDEEEQEDNKDQDHEEQNPKQN